MDVEYGQYSVILLVEGFPPSHAGTITVYEDSQPGTLNDFLGAMTEDDARPEALRRFELMVEEVARNASAVAQNTAAAKKSASDAGTSASEAATHATDAAGSARAASTSAGQAASSAQRRLPAQERHQQRPLKHQKCCRCRVLKKRGGYQCRCGENVRNECRSVRNNQPPLLHPPRPRKRQKPPPQPGMRRPQRGGKIIRNERIPRAPAAQLPRQRRQEIPRRRQKRPRRTLSLLKRQRNRAPAIKLAADSENSSCGSASEASKRQRQAAVSATAAGKSAESAVSSASNSHNEGWRSVY